MLLRSEPHLEFLSPTGMISHIIFNRNFPLIRNSVKRQSPGLEPDRGIDVVCQEGLTARDYTSA